MAKIPDLPPAGALDGTEDFILEKEGVTSRTSLAAAMNSVGYDRFTAIMDRRPGRASFLVPDAQTEKRRVWSAGEDASGFAPMWGDEDGAVHISRASPDLIEAVGGSHRLFTFGAMAAIVGADGRGFAVDPPERTRFFTFGAAFVVADQDGTGFDISPPVALNYLAFTVEGDQGNDVALIDAASDRSVRLTYGDADNFAPVIDDGVVRWVRRTSTGLSVRQQSLMIPDPTGVAPGVDTLWQVIGVGQSPMQGADSYAEDGSVIDPDGAIAPGRVKEFAAGVNPGGNGLDTPATDAEFGPLSDMESGSYSPDETDAGTTIFPRMLFGCLDTLGADAAMLGTALGRSGASYDVIKKGSVYYANALAAVRRGRLLAFLDGLYHRVPFFANLHGEADRWMSMAAFTACLVEHQGDLQTDLRRILMNGDFILPIILSQMSSWTYYNDLPSGRSEVPLAQLQVAIDAPSKFICVGPKYHLTYFNGTPHPMMNGQRKHGEEFARAARALLSSFDAHGNPNGTYSPLRAVSAVRVGDTVTVQVTGHVGNLVIDAVRITDPGNYGIGYRDVGGANVAVSNVAVTDPVAGRFSFKIASALDGVVDIAMRGVPGAAPGAVSGPRACLRDTSPEISAVDGQPLFKWICHGEIPATA